MVSVRPVDFLCVGAGGEKGGLLIQIKKTIPALLLALTLALTAGLSPGARAAEGAENAAALGPRDAPAEQSSAGAWERYTQRGSEEIGTAELRVTAPETHPKAGESFTVTVDLVGNPGFAAVQFTLPYDKDAVTCTSANTGELMRGMLAASNTDAPEGAIVAGASIDPVRGDGRMAVFTFTAKRDLASGEFRLEDVLLSDVDGTDLICTVTRAVTAAPAPPEEQRDLEKEAEAVIAEIESGTPRNPEKEEPKEETPESRPPAFTDMAGHPFETDVARAAELGIINGYPDGTFQPDSSLTRAQFVTILYRQAGRPAVTETTPFTDIAGVNEEFRTAIAWAYGKKLVDGSTPTTFNPQGTLSRQATMKILFQLGGGTAGAEQMFYGTYDGTFPDSGKLADWARTPVYWGVYNTLIEAGEGNALNPAAPATRGQLARSMVRYIEKFGEEGTA